MGTSPGTILVANGSSATYPNLTFGPLPAAQSGSETISLNTTVPSGLTVKFFKNSLSLSTDFKSSIQMTIGTAPSLAPGDYKVTVVAHYGTNSKSFDFTVKVVQYLVSLQGNNFSPGALTLKTGSIVWWINMDAPAGGDPEIHNVVFSSGSTAHSPDMAQYDSYSQTFTTAGAYAYFCAYHPGMKGTVTVTA
jgi:plastocyanin